VAHLSGTALGSVPVPKEKGKRKKKKKKPSVNRDVERKNFLIASL
jgi:hypothetical protein